jgi:hypothetical protein
MTIRKITIEDIDPLERFFQLANTSDDHRPDTFSMVSHFIETDDYYLGYANFVDDEILSACFIRELIEQKVRVLDFIVTKKNTSIRNNLVNQVLDHALIEGERRGFFRFYTCITEDMLETVDYLKKKNAVFSWRSRYDTYLDEVIPSQCFSTYYIHWNYIMNNTLRHQSKCIRHHLLKSEYREKYQN